MNGPTSLVIAALEAGGYGPHPSGSGWASRCSGHDDKVASLSIGEGRDGRALVTCFAGCDLARILEPLGLAPRDLFAERQAPTEEWTTTRYRVCDRTGGLVAVHVRRDGPGGKRFHWERGGKAGLGGLRVAELPLYGAETVAESAGPVFVVEGEKACDALRARGFAAVGSVCGAASTPVAEVLTVLAGRDVVLWTDADTPGREHMARVAERLQGVATSVRVFDPPHAPPGGDAFDFFEGGGTAGDVLAMLPNAASVEQDKGAAIQAHEKRPATASVTVTRLSAVEPRALSWLWRNYIPRGMVTVVAGDGGQGKSTLVLDIAARVTRGRPMPDGTAGLGAPASVVILSAEDELGSVLVPRLGLADADLDRVVTVGITTPEGEDRPPMVTPEDLSRLEAVVRELGARLVVWDPLAAYVDAETNLHHNQDARRVLARLHGLAERNRAAVVGVHHFNRSTNPGAVHRLTGSPGIGNAARSVLVVGPEPDEPTGERMVLAVAKRNLAPRSTPSLVYRLDVPPGSEHPTVKWIGESSSTADDLVTVPSSPDERSDLEDATTQLRDLLANGPTPVNDLRSSMKGTPERALRKAKKRLGVVSERQDPHDTKSPWVWRLPRPEATPEPQPEGRDG